MTKIAKASSVSVDTAHLRACFDPKVSVSIYEKCYQRFLLESEDTIHLIAQKCMKVLQPN